MHTLSLDLRERILSTYDEGRSTREEVAKRFRVSLGMVKKLLCQRVRLEGDLRPQHHRSGRKPKILPRHRERMRTRLAREPDLTLQELRRTLRLDCSLPALHYALQALGLSYKKRHCAPANKTAPISPKPAGSGKSSKSASIPPG
jgi:transposase